MKRPIALVLLGLFVVDFSILLREERAGDLIITIATGSVVLRNEGPIPVTCNAPLPFSEASPACC